MSARPLDIVRINQSPIQLVCRNPFNQFSSRILRVVTYPFSFSATWPTPSIPVQVGVPLAIRIPVSTRRPNTPHHRHIESVLSDEEPSTAKVEQKVDENNHEIDAQENDMASTAPPLIHGSEN